MLSFFLSATDQNRIDPTSIIVEDATGENLSTLPDDINQVPDQSLIIRFKISDPQNGAPRLLPFYSGHLVYTPFDNGTDILPELADVDPQTRWIDNWQTRGRICIRADRNSLASANVINLDAMVSDDYARLVPNKVWYYPVRLTPEFLFDELLGHSSLVLDETGETSVVPAADVSFAPRVISDFFRQRFEHWVREEHIVAGDNSFKMPTVDMASNGNVTLVVNMALEQLPQDFEDAFDNLSPEIDRTDPDHVANGHIPPRHVFQAFRQDMQHADSTSALVGQVADKNQSPVVYTPIRFTRTASNQPNCSVQFPTRTVDILDTAGEFLWSQRLPAHGHIFLPSPRGQVPADISVQLPGELQLYEMTYLKGAADCWKRPGKLEPLEFNLATEAEPHVVLRNRMATILFHETFHERTHLYGDQLFEKIKALKGSEVRVDTCSYMSLRRTIHAWLDNRITGGRYQQENRLIKPETRALLAEVFPEDIVKILAWHGPSRTLYGDVNAQLAMLRIKASILKTVAMHLFPDPAPTFVAGATADPDYSMGRVFYDLWQTIGVEFRDADNSKYYPDEHVGRGAAGALVYLGLASYVVKPEPATGQALDDPALLAINVAAMMDDKKPGTMLQMWCRAAEDYGNVINRVKPPKGTDEAPGYGHSPIFFSYSSEDDIALLVVDHQGLTAVTLDADSGLLDWQGWPGSPEQIWIAAEWLE